MGSLAFVPPARPSVVEAVCLDNVKECGNGTRESDGYASRQLVSRSSWQGDSGST